MSPSPKPKATVAGGESPETVKRHRKASETLSADTSADVSLGAPSGPTPFNPTWEHYPDPSRLYFGATDLKPRDVDFSEAFDRNSDSWRIVTPDNERFFDQMQDFFESNVQEPLARIKEKAKDDDELVGDLEEKVDDLEREIENQSIDKEDRYIDEVVDAAKLLLKKKAFKADAAEIIAGCEKIEEVLEDMDGLTDQWPDAYMNYIWPMPCCESEAENIAIALKDTICYLIQEEASNDYYLLMAAGGMDLSDRLVDCYVKAGYYPPMDIASGYLSSWGAKQASEASNDPSVEYKEKVIGRHIACLKTMEWAFGQAERGIQRVSENLKVLNFEVEKE